MNRRGTTIATAGFTLIEVTLVVAILAVISAIALPRMAAAADRRRADLAARKLAADLAWVQMAARAQTTSSTLTLDSTGVFYTLGNVTDAAHPISSLIINLSRAPFSAKVGTSSAGVFTLSAYTLTFGPTGIPSATVTLMCKSGQAVRSVTISRPGGAITVQ